MSFRQQLKRIAEDTRRNPSYEGLKASAQSLVSASAQAIIDKMGPSSQSHVSRSVEADEHDSSGSVPSNDRQSSGFRLPEFDEPENEELVSSDADDPDADSEPIQFCAQLDLPEDETERTSEMALKESDIHARVEVDMPDIVLPGISQKIGLERRTMWKNGSTIRVGFMGGSAYVQSKIRKYAVQWEQYANIHFAFVSAHEHADIRISFVWGDGSWSKLGTDALRTPAGQATMNYGWFNNRTPDVEFARTTLHEFGHALGCVHEHSQPNANIQWNKEVVYAEYWRTQHWTRIDVDFQVFKHYTHQEVAATAFDRYSIMEYPIPARFTWNGFSAPNNSRLSQTDIQFISKMYPRGTVTKPTGCGTGYNGNWTGYRSGENLECSIAVSGTRVTGGGTLSSLPFSFSGGYAGDDGSNRIRLDVKFENSNLTPEVYYGELSGDEILGTWQVVSDNMRYDQWQNFALNRK